MNESLSCPVTGCFALNNMCRLKENKYVHSKREILIIKNEEFINENKILIFSKKNNDNNKKLQKKKRQNNKKRKRRRAKELKKKIQILFKVHYFNVAFV